MCNACAKLYTPIDLSKDFCHNLKVEEFGWNFKLNQSNTNILAYDSILRQKW